MKFNKGQGLIEYALILSLVAIVVIIVLALLGPAIGNVFSTTISSIEDLDSNLVGDDAPPDCYGSILLPALLAVLMLLEWGLVKFRSIFMSRFSLRKL